MVKLLYQFDKIWEDNFSENWNLKLSVKFIVENVLKRQEYFLCYLLTLMGIDVCLLQYKKDLPDELIKLNLSKEIVLGPFSDKNTSIYSPEKYIDSEAKKEITQETHMNKNISKPPVLISYHKQSNKKNNLKEDNIKNSEPLEKNFEELALLASSVVMISIHDDREEIIGTGSGIMIGEKGYILTNNHVASGGRFYSVRIEDDSETYFTDEVIKYNTVFDLAIIRIDRKLNPLPVYSGQKKLVRGQKVVAIGSPLGLFNSVSDGIISGFRNIDGVDMIQFTAPISHGSSGGAVLNMFGEVIGISTAGFDNGQNINLAVGYEFINNFKRGF
jgi:S1-C subfamily serine protease